LKAAGETETKQENIEDWLELALTNKEIAAVISFCFIFISTTYIIIFSIYLFPPFFVFKVFFLH
jgi:hypothetical protein